MFDCLQTLMQTFFVISLLDGDLLSTDDRPGIYRRCDVMDCASRHLYSGIECLLHCMKSAKYGYGGAIAGDNPFTRTIICQEGGMEIDDALRELVEEAGTQNVHPPCEHDEIGLKQVQEGGQFDFAPCELLPW